MSLDWSVRNVKDFETVCQEVADYDAPNRGIKVGDRIWKPITQGLVWATMAVGFSSITEANAAEFYGRLRLWELVSGSFVTTVEGDVLITLEDVRAHIGLYSNASKVSPTEFLTRLVKNAVEQAEARERRLAREKGDQPAA
jgi:hypothetical protein